jgi:hypothetical protein
MSISDEVTKLDTGLPSSADLFLTPFVFSFTALFLEAYYTLPKQKTPSRKHPFSCLRVALSPIAVV